MPVSRAGGIAPGWAYSADCATEETSRRHGEIASEPYGHPPVKILYNFRSILPLLIIFPIAPQDIQGRE
jgi:hypothetical protein